MISSYRLGDLVFNEYLFNENELNEIITDYPNSIASEYILEKRNNMGKDGISTMIEIVLRHIEKYKNQLPQDISTSICIHLRLGDVVAGNEWHEKMKRPLDINIIKQELLNYTDKKYIIGKCFFAKASSTNYEECIYHSNRYLQNAIEILEAQYFNSENADIDLCCAVKSKLFVQGRGFFSALIVLIRDRLNFDSIKTEVTKT